MYDMIILVLRASLTQHYVCPYPAHEEKRNLKMEKSHYCVASKLTVRRRVENPSL